MKINNGIKLRLRAEKKGMIVDIDLSLVICVYFDMH